MVRLALPRCRVQSGMRVIRQCAKRIRDDSAFVFQIDQRFHSAQVRWSKAMTALPSPSQNQQGASAADPSMEEILASIRRIIADDQGAPLTPRPSRSTPTPVVEITAPAAAILQPPAPAPAPAQPAALSRMEPPRLRPSQDPFTTAKLREPMAVIEPPVRAFGEGGVLGERVARLESEPLRSRPVLRHMFEPPAEAAIGVAAASPQASQDMAEISEERAASVGVEALLSPLTRASVTSAFDALTVSMTVQNSSMVEDAVRDMLRPMLKDWLDNNLPTIVERLVRTEIERVARGGRS